MLWTQNEFWYTLAALISAIMAAVLANSVMKRRYSLAVTWLGWTASLALYFGLVYACFLGTSWMQYDYFLFFGWVVILPFPCLLLYRERPTTKLFVSISTVFLANVTSFITGSITTTLFPPVTEYFAPGFTSFLIPFSCVKLVVSAVMALLVLGLLRRSIVQVLETMDGKMGRYLVIPLVTAIGFFFLVQIVQKYGLIVSTGFDFVAFFVMICVIFALLYWLIFSNVIWSSRVLKTAAELSVASNIQQDMLPRMDGDFSGQAAFDICATMQPAKDVGGDFYDFFFVDDTHLAVVVADVSGKGVPAALFMVIAKTIIKNQAQTGATPAEVFTKANNQLCETNGEGMFVTAFMGVLDTESGLLTYVNAGHNPPLVKQNGQYQWLKAKPGFVLAGMEDIRYRQAELQLEPGDILYLYTDGVTEALNQSQELYSDPRLLLTLNQAADLPVAELLPYVKQDIDAFAKGAEQADDITMLGLAYKGGVQ